VPPEWVEPLRAEYRGVEVTQLPPNTQGLTLLQMLNMLADHDLSAWGYGSAELIHQVLERKKLAFQDRDAYVGDPACVDVPVERLLDRDYARRQAAGVTATAGEIDARDMLAGGRGDTVYLCTADRDGNVVSLIQSLFDAWGSGVVVPGTGIALQNRGSGFQLTISRTCDHQPRRPGPFHL
jgi:gamma-glutamyltranspeptidase